MFKNHKKLSTKESNGIGITGRVRIIQRDAKTGTILDIGQWSKNVVLEGSNLGKQLIAQRLGSNNTYSLNITYGEMGKGATAVDETDTVMEDPIVRGPFAYASVSGLVVTTQFFFPDNTVPDDTYTEFGTFVDGTTTLGTGQFFNHVLFTSPYVKTSGIDTTVEVEFTIS